MPLPLAHLPARAASARELLELLFAVGEVAGVAERTVALREVLAQAHLVELVGFGRRTPLLDAVLARLHLRNFTIYTSF